MKNDSKLIRSLFLYLGTLFLASVAAAQTQLPSGQVGIAYSFQIQISPAASETTVYSATGLPSGLSINSSTGLISGIPNLAGSFAGTVTLSDEGESNNLSVAIDIDSAPDTPNITSSTSANGTVGSSFSYTLSASDSPTSYNIGSLPTGLSYDAIENTIGGTPLAAGTYPIAISANNANGEGDEVTLTIEIAAAGDVPEITSNSSLSGDSGSLISYQIVASNDATSYAASGLPLGVTIDSETGFISGTPTIAASYSIELTASNSFGTSAVFTLALVIGDVPQISSNLAVTATEGDTLSYKVTATNSPTSFSVGTLPAGLTYDSVTTTISGTLSTVGEYSFTLSGINAIGDGPVSTVSITVEEQIILEEPEEPAPEEPETPEPEDPPTEEPEVTSDQLVNISTRGFVSTGLRAMVAGFVISGEGEKEVLIRAIGPQLGVFGLNGVLENPTVEIRNVGGDTVASNDNWGDENSSEIEATSTLVGAFQLEPGSGDAAIKVSLPAGTYSAIVKGVEATEGIGLIEVYDADEAENSISKLINISTRGYVGTGGSAMVSGFVVRGETAKQFLIRGIGPTLGTFGIPETLENSFLKITRASDNSEVGTNDDWESENKSAIETASATVGAFALGEGSKDAVILITLEPGGYTVKQTGPDGATGIALLEIYEVE